MATSRFTGAAVEGLKDVVAAFQRAPAVVQDRLGTGATQPTAFSLLQRAKARVRVRYGFLKQALDYTYHAKTGEARVGIRRGARFPIPGTRRFSGQSDMAMPSKYGHLVEFGHGRVKAYPFMIPSAEQERDPYLARCRAAGRQIERDLATVGGRFL